MMWQLLLCISGISQISSLLLRSRIKVGSVLFQDSLQLGMAGQRDSNRCPLPPASNADRMLGDVFSSPGELHATDAEPEDKVIPRP